jgi:hypothetical protein
VSLTRDNENSPIFQGSPDAIDRLIPHFGGNAPENNLGNPLITSTGPFSPSVPQLRPHDNRENQSNDNFPFTKGIF